MKYVVVSALTLILLASSARADKSEDERQAKQAELDAACEAAREVKLAQERARHIEECVETELLEDRETCERFYADYGESAARRAPLFYDLPECEKAHEFRNSYRNPDAKQKPVPSGRLVAYLDPGAARVLPRR